MRDRFHAQEDVRLLGHVTVDSGVIAIVDPVNVVRDEGTWQGWVSQERVSMDAQETLFSGDSGTGIWATTGASDRYAVLGRYVDGRLVEIVIPFPQDE